MKRLSVLLGVVAAYAPSQLYAADPTNPPPLRPTDQYDAVPLLSNQELGLSVGVLLFGLIIVVIEYKLLLAVKCDADAVIRALTVTLIIVVSLALVASGYGKDQITPVLGLFGTIVGYLLGSANKGSSEK